MAGLKYVIRFTIGQYIFLGVHSMVPILAIQGDMGWVSPKYRRCLKLFMLWNHFVILDNTTVTKQVFEWDMDRKHDNWSADMENLFDLVGQPLIL